MPTFPCDLHVHTIYSGHSQPDMLIPSIVRKADELGLEQIVVLEHVPVIDEKVQATILEDKWDPAFTGHMHLAAIGEELARLQDAAKVELLRGAEIDAEPHRCDGSLLMADRTGLDIVLASTHYLPEGRGLWHDGGYWPEPTLEIMWRQWLDWMVALAANPAVDILAHPGASMGACGAIPWFAGDILRDFERILIACREHDTAFELNELLPRKLSEEQAATYYRVIGMARELGVAIAVGSDAHELGDLGKFEWVVEVATKAGLSEEDLFRPVQKAPHPTRPE